MRRIIILITLLTSLGYVSAQHRDSEDVIKKLMWDNEKLNILIDTRIDFQTQWQKEGLNNLSFHGEQLKLWFVGDITPKIHYRLRQNILKMGNLTRDGYTTATDQAWISFDIGNRWCITVGKQAVQFGTFEYDYSNADMYLSTLINSDIDGSKAGVNASYKIAGQTFNAQIVNSDATQFASSEDKNIALALNLLWAGSLWDGLLKTRWGYGAFQHKGDKFYNWVTLGTQLNLNKFTAEYDYYHGDRHMNYGSVVNDTLLGLRPVRDQSMALNLKYDFGMFKSAVKGIWDKRYDREMHSNAYNRKGIEAVVECYPFTTKLLSGLRFHAAYTFCSTDFEGEFNALATENVQTFLVGTRWMFKAK